MAQTIFLILLCLMNVCNSQWILSNEYLSSNQKFTFSNSSDGYEQSGSFALPSSTTSAQFITCITPSTSYINLNSTEPSAYIYQKSYFYQGGSFINFDLFFQGTWSNQTVVFTIGSAFTYTYTYISPTIYPITQGFCDNLTGDVKSINFTLTNSISDKVQFQSTGSGNAQVSIKNIFFSRILCYPSCTQCTGSNFNQCTNCIYGQATDNICPLCPSNQYFMKYQGCKDICDINSPIYYHGFCQSYPIFLIASAQIYQDSLQSENLKWSIIYDPLHIDTSPKPSYVSQNYYFYGIFMFNSGIYRFFDLLSSYSTYLIGLKISIVLFNDIPLNCGIQFKINNTYYGSIYKNDSGIQTHKLKIYQTYAYNSYLTYSQSKIYNLITYLDIPQSTILFSAVGNYTEDTAGWGIISVQFTSGYCSNFCLLCEVSFKCKTCQNEYYKYKDGSCIQSCSNSFQKLNGSYCYDYDDETPYSQYLIQEYTNRATDPNQYQQYTLLSQNGSNFLKGSDIYYSYWNQNRVFGGPFVWAQAKFQRIHNIIDPHHSITIAFYIIFGPKFPSDGRFIYTIEDNTPVSKSSATFQQLSPDGSKYDKIYERIIHNANSLKITWECSGANNEPIYAFCGFYNYYIAVHYCQPYCLQCQDQNTCLEWNSTYDVNIVKFSQAQCEITQYFDRDSFKCFQCLLPCLTCTSKIDCQTCLPTYTQTKLGCICKMNQYEDTNKCFDCPYECNQCLSSTYCIECLITNNRKLINGQCNCIDGYYSIISNPQCQLCHQFCKTCSGPTSHDCLTCSNIINIEKIGSTCKCQTGLYYQDASRTCSQCHLSCQTCFKNTIDGCLTCNPTLNRILKGLVCECAPGYYDLNNICINCPTNEDITLIQCYKYCNNNLSIWHTNICSSCDFGFQLVFGECQPICGDLNIKGYEQCEDNNSNLNDLCYNCQYQCPTYCQTCDSTTTLPCPDICGDGVISGTEECEDGNSIQYDGCYNCKYQCQPQCTKCINGECFECATKGWFIDPTITSSWLCKERCGDQIITGYEQCDDGNQVDTDGCKNCRFHCRIGCSSCNYNTNTCLSCQLPGFVPFQYYCKNICGDGLVVIDPSGINSEQCDDGNTIDFDGCSSNCQFQCQPSTICTSCVNNRCESCASEFKLSSDKICNPICGDSKLVSGEQCEITQVLPYKGCQNCQAKCQTSCKQCNNTGIGCNFCQPGYERIDYLCYSICGDQIVTDDEQCDDGNIIYGDGCHFCQYTCQDSCFNCIKGVCYDCQEGYQLIQSKCYTICGDKVKADDEQCEIVDLQQSFQNCQLCKFSCNVNCHSCLYGICQQCNDGYELSFNQIYCQKSLQNTQLLFENCKIQIKNSCIKCEEYAYYNKIEQLCKLKQAPMNFCEYQLKLQPDFYCSQCFQHCDKCNENNCILCKMGYYLDTSFQCNSYCGDGILAHDEQCEIFDQNCLSCMYEAPKLCEQYFENNCQKCEHGYYFNQYSNTCESYCGDGIVAHDEDCEDNNYLEFDGCYHCKYSCSQLCKNCMNGICYKCELDYFLYDGICLFEKKDTQCSIECQLCLQGKCLICEKEYKLNEYGDCISSCQDGCLNCIQGLCYLCGNQYYLYYNNCILIEECSLGLYLNQKLLKCEPQCGDGYITGWEECDDSNILQYDGCYLCKYECIQNCFNCIYGECINCLTEFDLIENKCLSKCQETCIQCIQGACQLCINGYVLDEYKKCTKIDCEHDFSCTQICGNGIIEEQEQCDDQNFSNDDTCNNLCEQICDVNCINCIDGICYQCKQGWKLGLYFCDSICGDEIIVGNEQCDDGNINNYDGCFNCQLQCAQNCLDCQLGICQLCQLDFQLDQLNNSCKPIQTSLLTKVQADCKLLNNQQCIFCQYGYLDLITNTCIIDYNINKCSNNCKQCLFEQCLECEHGYYGNKCIPKCGDGIVVKEEECDDGNQYQIDSCLNCQQSCPLYCQKCAYGICTHCLNGFYLDIVSNSCSSICGDNILANDEVCDDGNEFRYDGCFKCNYQCQMECLNCQFGRCLLCESSLILVPSKGVCEQLKQCEGLIGLYYDSFTNDCLSLCGDGIIAGNEQCEDQNIIPYDGCYECKYQCNKKCSNCQKGTCYECQIGYHLEIQKCITKCGDGIKIGDEQCDDKNDIVRDGCSYCKIDPLYKCEENQDLLSFCYKCQDNCNECKYDNNFVECLSCESGYFLKDNTCISCSEKCEECVNTPNNCTKCSTIECKQCHNISGFYLDKSSKSCITKCGDNITAGTEQCDDGNLIDQDGCNSKCEIEKEFICNEGICFVQPQKYIDLIYSNSTTRNDLELMYDDNELDGICDQLKIWIEYFEPEEFQYQIYKQENQTNIGQGKCEIKFNFFKSILESNLIHIIIPLKDNVTRILQETREIIITPRRLVYYTEDQNDQAQNVVSASSSFTFILQLIGPMTILLGGFNIFWTILDILTWINNFYFLNVDYPLNVKLFFKKFEWGDVFNIPEIYNLNTPQDPYYFEAPPKFIEKDVNPLFLNNIQLISALTLLAIIAYSFSVCVVSNIQKIFQSQFEYSHKIEIFSINQIQQTKEAIFQKNHPNKIKKLKKQEMPFLIKIIYKETLNFKINFRTKLLQIFGLVFLDLCLASFLQLKYRSQSEFAIIKLNILLAIIGIIIIILMFKIYSFVCSQHSILYETKIFQNYYSSLYEGFNTKNFFGRNYCYVNLMRKTMFIFFTIYFYEVPLLQTSFCCLPCFFNIALIMFQNPFENRSQLLQQAIPDFCIFIIILITALLAIHDVSNILSFDQKYMIGWVILFFILLSIFLQIIFLLKQFGLEIRTRLIQIKEFLSLKAQEQK